MDGSWDPVAVRYNDTSKPSHLVSFMSILIAHDRRAYVPLLKTWSAPLVMPAQPTPSNVRPRPEDKPHFHVLVL